MTQAGYPVRPLSRRTAHQYTRFVKIFTLPWNRFLGRPELPATRLPIGAALVGAESGWLNMHQRHEVQCFQQLDLPQDRDLYSGIPMRIPLRQAVPTRAVCWWRAVATAAVAIVVIASASLSPAAQAGARERTLFLSAVDRDGAPVDNLTVDDLVVREDGVQREVLRVSRATEPIDIVLLADNSASSSDLLPPMREGLKKFVTAMTAADGPRHNIALVALAARPTLLVDYTSNRQQLEAGIGRLFTERSNGMTLLDALVEVSQGLQRREASRAVIVPVITDGTEFTNRYHREVVDAMTRAGAALHAITVGTFSVTQDDAVRNRAIVLDDGPRATGGQRALLLSASGVPAALEKLARELSSQYKVVYGRPESLIPPEKTDVSSTRAGVTVRATPARGQNRGA